MEFVGWIKSDSFAVISDSMHVAVDFVFFLTGVRVATLELKTGTEMPDARRVGAYVHGVMFLPLAMFVAIAASKRFAGQDRIDGTWMFFSALFGLLGNIWQVRISRRVHNITEKGAHLHNLTDCLASAVVLVAAPLVMLGAWAQVDVWASLGVALVMVVSGALLIYEARNGHTHHH